MRDDDYRTFAAMLDQVCALLSKGSHKPDPQSTALWFRVLTPYDLEAVRRAFDAHVRDPDRGRFVPVPADIIAKIHAQDGRPSSDEAWAIAVKGADESATVTWNDEIAEAWGIAKPVLDGGDEVGARMAFRDAYNRISEERKGQPVRWWPSLGHDPAGRAAEVARASVAGLLEHQPALLLAAPNGMTLEGIANRAPPHVRGRLMALRDKLAARPDADAYVPNPDLLRTAELKQRAQDLTDAFTSGTERSAAP